MAYDKLVDSIALDTGLKAIADAIREKVGTSDSLAFPTGFSEAIASISAGGGGVTLPAGYAMDCGVVVLAESVYTYVIDLEHSYVWDDKSRTGTTIAMFAGLDIPSGTLSQLMGFNMYTRGGANAALRRYVTESDLVSNYANNTVNMHSDGQLRIGYGQPTPLAAGAHFFWVVCGEVKE